MTEELQALYQTLNALHFGGALPPYIVRQRSRSGHGLLRSFGTAGYCIHERARIVLASNLKGENLRRTMLHEMCHVATRGQEDRLHGPLFAACLKRVADAEPSLGDFASGYAGQNPNFLMPLTDNELVREALGAVARLHCHRPWRRVRVLVADQMDMGLETFQRLFPDAREQWQEIAARERSWQELNQRARPPMERQTS